MHKRAKIGTPLSKEILGNKKVLLDEGFEQLDSYEAITPTNASWRHEVDQSSEVYMKMVSDKCDLLLLYVELDYSRNQAYVAKECGMCL